jgi:hypothetical protein
MIHLSYILDGGVLAASHQFINLSLFFLVLGTLHGQDDAGIGMHTEPCFPLVLRAAICCSTRAPLPVQPTQSWPQAPIYLLDALYTYK